MDFFDFKQFRETLDKNLDNILIESVKNMDDFAKSFKAFKRIADKRASGSEMFSCQIRMNILKIGNARAVFQTSKRDVELAKQQWEVLECSVTEDIFALRENLYGGKLRTPVSGRWSNRNRLSRLSGNLVLNLFKTFE